MARRRRQVSWVGQVESFVSAFAIWMDPSSSIVDQMAGDLYRLLFEILPDKRSRTDIHPICIGIDSEFENHTLYRAQYGAFKVEYSASPDRVIVRRLYLDDDVEQIFEILAA